VFEKPKTVGQHMKPLYIKGHLNGNSVNRMLVDGGACVNIMPETVFERLGHTEKDLMKTNMTLSSFSGEASDAKGIVLMELTVGSKTVPMAFFVVNVKGKYNILLGKDWIHANGCVRLPFTSA
jgi:predicted aspartyl protease